MTFFYDLNKRLADLAAKQDATQVNEGQAKRLPGLPVTRKDVEKKFGGSAVKMAKAAKEAGFSDARIRQAMDDLYQGKNPNDIDEADYSAKKAAAGKDIGKPGKMFSKIAKSAGKEYGSKAAGERVAGAVLNKLRAKEDVAQEGNEFSGELAQARASGAKSFNVDGKEYPVKEGSKPMTSKQKKFAKLAPPVDKITFADRIAGAKKEVDEMLGDVAAEAIKQAVKKAEPRSKGTAFDADFMKQQQTKKDAEAHSRYDVTDTGYSKRYTRKATDTDIDAGDEVKSDAPKAKGRPKGTKRAIGAKGPTGRSKLMSKDSIKETDAEYDQEGDMAKDQLHTLTKAAKELDSILSDDQNLPEWVQSKITKALDYIKTANDYMDQERHDSVEPVAEKAVSKKQQKFMGMVHATQKGEKPASKEVAKVAKTMGKKDAKDFASTKHKGLPEKAKTKKEESVEETSEAPKEKKAKGGYDFGGGIYESLDRQFAQALSEGMNVSVNMSTGQDGQPTKSINISADGEDADRLAELLKMAGIHGSSEETCETCGQEPCGCESLEENSPDWPTDTETSDNALQYSGGLNGPKSTGQTTTPVIASQLRRQVSMEEGVKLERNLLDLYKVFKNK